MSVMIGLRWSFISFNNLSCTWIIRACGIFGVDVM